LPNVILSQKVGAKTQLTERIAGLRVMKGRQWFRPRNAAQVRKSGCCNPGTESDGQDGALPQIPGFLKAWLRYAICRKSPWRLWLPSGPSAYLHSLFRRSIVMMLHGIL